MLAVQNHTLTVDINKGRRANMGCAYTIVVVVAGGMVVVVGLDTAYTVH